VRIGDRVRVIRPWLARLFTAGFGFGQWAYRASDPGQRCHHTREDSGHGESAVGTIEPPQPQPPGEQQHGQAEAAAGGGLAPGHDRDPRSAWAVQCAGLADDVGVFGVGQAVADQSGGQPAQPDRGVPE
jgi:hypothetical protein